MEADVVTSKNAATELAELKEAAKIAVEITQVVGKYLEAWSTPSPMGPRSDEISDLVERLQGAPELTRPDLPLELRLAVARINPIHLDHDLPALRELLVRASAFSGVPFSKTE